MPTQHTVLELTAGKDAQQSPAAMAEFFSSLPQRKLAWWHHLLQKDERVSFEIIVQRQQIRFLVFLPIHLHQYISASLTASYPELQITPLEGDPLRELAHPLEGQVAQEIVTGKMRLKRSSKTSDGLKTHQAFSETDSSASLLSTLSKAGAHTQLAVQFVIGNEVGAQFLQKIPQLSQITTGSDVQKSAQVEGSLPKQHSLRVAIKLAARCESQQEAQLWLEALASSLQVVNTPSSSLEYSRTYIAKEHFLNQMLERSHSRAPALNLSLDELATLYHPPGKSVSNITGIHWGKALLGEPPLELPIITQESSDDSKQRINPFARTMFKNEPTVYGLRKKDRRRHLYVIGKTGTGKSTLLANMAINDLKRGEGLCVIDPHGDLIDTLLDYIPKSRINDVIYFDPADSERTVQINLFEGESVVHRELIASGIVSIFKKLYAYSWGPRLEYILRNALLTLLKTESARLSDILDLLTDEKFRAQIVSKLDDDVLKHFWVREYNKMSERQRNESIASILNKVGQFVSSPLVRDVVNARKSSFSIEDAMNEGKIILANLSQGRLGEDNATLLGSMLITKIQLAAMARVEIPESERRDFFLYVDEFQNFATESFTKILSEARKYRLSITLANQYIAQIPEEVQKAIFGNCGSVISFVMGAEDARVFSQEYGSRYTEAELVSLGRYQIINKISIDNIISDPFPANTLALAASNNKNRQKVIKVSRERYAKLKKK